MDLQFATLDVFTSTRFEGNPLAVVSVSAALEDRLSQAAKQRIAREFNLSETVFLHEPAGGEDDESSNERRIDIFTTEQEIPFAGHPTIGTAVLLRHGGAPHVDTLVTKAGPIRLVSASEDTPVTHRALRAKIPHDVHVHANTLGAVLGDAADTYPGLSPDPVIRAAELAAPVVSVVRGMTFVLVRLPSLAHLARVAAAERLDFARLPAPLLDDGPWRESFVCRYYWVDVDEKGADNQVEEGGGGGKEGEKGTRHLRTRMVEFGIEDPATGSAASALAAYLTLRQESGGAAFRLTQGVEMGRRSDIEVETTTREADGGVELVDLWLGGTAVVVMKGSLTVDA
ncbi:Diaminopimelate epimerase-like protein [Hypoxylon sp. FL1284]|nr:Diaminopimelate epimerase-like protein [Hypoxylon sp. FL1284]